MMMMADVAAPAVRQANNFCRLAPGAVQPAICSNARALPTH